MPSMDKVRCIYTRGGMGRDASVLTPLLAFLGRTSSLGCVYSEGSTRGKVQNVARICSCTLYIGANIISVSRGQNDNNGPVCKGL